MTKTPRSHTLAPQGSRKGGKEQKDGRTMEPHVDKKRTGS